LKASQVGEKAFLEKWGRMTTDGHITWGPDPSLTALGEDQARDVNLLLEQERSAGMPMPQAFYVSPLTRACHTLQLAYSTVKGSDSPLIMENLREGKAFVPFIAR
jgi:broad specificity phosphatase PhoE